MQDVSAIFEELLLVNHHIETKLEIALINGSVTVNEDKIMSISTSSSAFMGDNPSVGNAVAAEIDFSIIKPDYTIPRMARVSPWIRVVGEADPDTRIVPMSEWIQKGTFYIDTRSYEDNGLGQTVMTAHGFDAMLKAEKDFPLNCPLFNNGNSTDIAVTNYIAEQMGCVVDARTYEYMIYNYTVMRPQGYTMRDVLRYIAAMYAGSFVISDATLSSGGVNKEQLRLIPLNCIEPETNYLIQESTGLPITFGTMPGGSEEVRILV
jgi:hypothetical protein